MAPDLREVRYLVAVAKAGSLTAATRDLHLTQPALSLALRKLEADVGVALLRRHARGVELTAAGEAFVGKAINALELIDDATLGARIAGGVLPPRLVIGMLPATFSELPRRLVDAFKAQHGSLTVRLRELSYITHTEDLVRGRVDLAFLWPPYRESRLRFLELSAESRVLGMSATHPLADNEELRLDEVLDLPFAGFHPASSGGWFDAWYFGAERGAPAQTTADESATPFEMAFSVQEGRAVAPAAQSFASAFAAPGVRWVPLTDAPQATLALAWNPQHGNPVVSAFVRLARALGACSMPFGLGLDGMPSERSSGVNERVHPAPSNHRVG